MVYFAFTKQLVINGINLLTFDRHSHNRRVLTSMFVGGTAEILTTSTREEHRLVFDIHYIIIISFKPSIDLHWRVCTAAADEGDVTASAHLRQWSGGH